MELFQTVESDLPQEPQDQCSWEINPQKLHDLLVHRDAKQIFVLVRATAYFLLLLQGSHSSFTSFFMQVNVLVLINEQLHPVAFLLTGFVVLVQTSEQLHPVAVVRFPGHLVIQVNRSSRISFQRD